MSNIGLKFTLLGGDVDFDFDEVGDVIIEPLFRSAIEQPLFRKTYVEQEGTEVKKITVNFLGDLRTTTRSKIQQLLDENDEIVFYYRYGYKTTDYITCVPFGKLERIYSSGYEVPFTYQLVFVQSS
jgi:hypothetical protein